MESSQLTDALRKYAYPLRTVEADDLFNDMDPLKELLRGVDIIGLGESTHGTREIFQLKHRLIRFLVENMGFRTVIMEAGVEPCQKINDYVLHGIGDRHKALSNQGYAIWDTTEVLDLIDWLREHNSRCRQGEKVQFLGCDMKPIEGACDCLLAYLLPLANQDYKKIESILLNCRNTVWMEPGQEISMDILWLIGWLRLNDVRLVAASSPEEYNEALKNSIYVYQYMQSMLSFNKENYVLRTRDRFMAENVIRIYKKLPPGSKTIIWAHNAHIAVDQSWQNQGWELRQYFGDRYYPMMICFGKGGFQANLLADNSGPSREIRGFYLEQPVENSWESDFDRALTSSHYLDLRSARKQSETLKSWMLETKPALRIGSGYSPNLSDEQFVAEYTQESCLADLFDGVCFLKRARRARLNPNGLR